MKKIGASLLLVIVLFQATPLHQLFKVPVLMEHYAEHCSRDGKIGFFEFLAMHYWGQDQNDNDEDRDMELPFRKANLQQLSYFVYQQVNTVPEPKAVIAWASAADYPIIQDNNFPDAYKGALFKPPRA